MCVLIFLFFSVSGRLPGVHQFNNRSPMIYQRPQFDVREEMQYSVSGINPLPVSASTVHASVVSRQYRPMDGANFDGSDPVYTASASTVRINNDSLSSRHFVAPRPPPPERRQSEQLSTNMQRLVPANVQRQVPAVAKDPLVVIVDMLREQAHQIAKLARAAPATEVAPEPEPFGGLQFDTVTAFNAFARRLILGSTHLKEFVSNYSRFFKILFLIIISFFLATSC